MKHIGYIVLILVQLSCEGQPKEKINGVSFVGSRDKATQQHIDPILKINANYAAVMPFGFVQGLDHPEIVFDTERQWYGETRAGGKQYIQILQRNGIKIMLKPQIWVWRGEFTGDLAMTTEADWLRLESTYEDFILTYAALAQETHAEIYCIGTELEAFVKHRPMFWKELITKVRAIYSGKLTYAANWDEYTRTPFWKELDFIGVDGYFPLSEAKQPTKNQLKEGWGKWKDGLRKHSKENGKRILFTEFGYRSMDYTGAKPWLVDRNDRKVNLKAQAEALEVVFEELWIEDWFAGGFVWKWFLHHDQVGGPKDNRFTPQNKPAEKALSRFYKIYGE